MRYFKSHQAKRKTYIKWDGKYYSTNNDWSNKNFKEVSEEEIPYPQRKGVGWYEGQANDLEDAYQKHIENQKNP